MKGAYECTVQEIGPGPNDQKELRVLGRRISFKNWGIQYEADPRHAEAIVAQLGLAQCDPVSTPWDKEASPAGTAEEL